MTVAGAGAAGKGGSTRHLDWLDDALCVDWRSSLEYNARLRPTDLYVALVLITSREGCRRC